MTAYRDAENNVHPLRDVATNPWILGMFTGVRIADGRPVQFHRHQMIRLPNAPELPQERRLIVAEGECRAIPIESL